MKKSYRAFVNISRIVVFEDNGEDSLDDQAFEAATSLQFTDDDIEVVEVQEM